MKEVIITETIIEKILPKYFQFVIKQTEVLEDGSLAIKLMVYFSF